MRSGDRDVPPTCALASAKRRYSPRDEVQDLDLGGRSARSEWAPGLDDGPRRSIGADVPGRGQGRLQREAEEEDRRRRKGRTLYMYTADTGGKPACAVSTPLCPKVWPALTTTGKPIAGKGINASRLRVVRGAGGSRAGELQPSPAVLLPRRIRRRDRGDKKAGDARGQGFLSAWYVLSPKGTPIK